MDADEQYSVPWSKTTEQKLELYENTITRFTATYEKFNNTDPHNHSDDNNNETQQCNFSEEIQSDDSDIDYSSDEDDSLIKSSDEKDISQTNHSENNDSIVKLQNSYSIKSTNMTLNTDNSV